MLLKALSTLRNDGSLQKIDMRKKSHIPGWRPHHRGQPEKEIWF